VAKLLVGRGADVDTITTHNTRTVNSNGERVVHLAGSTVLHVACRSGKNEIVELLLRTSPIASAGVAPLNVTGEIKCASSVQFTDPSRKIAVETRRSPLLARKDTPKLQSFSSKPAPI
jgi:ankyrin repeat protein